MKYTKKTLLFLLIIITISIFYFAYSTYSSYYQGVRSIESYNYAKNISSSLTKYYSAHLSYPGKVEELSLEQPDNLYVGKIIFDNNTGIIKIQLAGESLSEGVLIFYPEDIVDNNLSYACSTLSVPAEYIPSECTANEKPSISASQ